MRDGKGMAQGLTSFVSSCRSVSNALQDKQAEYTGQRSEMDKTETSAKAYAVTQNTPGAAAGTSPANANGRHHRGAGAGTGDHKWGGKRPSGGTPPS